MRLTGKTAVVTGGASGFGKGIVERFAAEGANVIIADIQNEMATHLANVMVANMGDTGGQIRAVHCDVSSSADMEAVTEFALSTFGGLDIFVNNAGIAHARSSLLDVGEAAFDKLFAVNVKSVYLAARHAVPVMQKSGGGVFLNIASTAGVRPRPGLTWYNATKGAMITMTKSMAVELAPDNIRVNAINPVAGETPLLATFLGEDTPEARAAFLATIPLGRFSQPADIAAAATFLCSDEAEFLTGVCMEVDGGRCI